MPSSSASPSIASDSGDSSSDGAPPSSKAMASTRRRKERLMTAQDKVDRFWDKFITKAPGQAASVIPRDQFAVKAAARRDSRRLRGEGQTTQASYEQAAELCRAKVAKIVRECRRVNQKYRDPHFDLEFDLKMVRRDCLDPLNNIREVEERRQRRKRRGLDSDDSDSSDDDAPARREAPHKDRGHRRGGAGGGGGGGGGGMLGLIREAEAESKVPPDAAVEANFRPMAVKRVVDIFEKPQFFIDGPTADDVRQGRDGDCWLLAALCTLSNKKGLIEKICVAHDQEVGVYGFVFHRDGEWISEIIDDKLYLSKPDYDEKTLERLLWEDRDRIDSEDVYRRTYQTNSGALYFAQCADPNETWLPLLEKAYAKAHGDYAVIEGGFTGEGLEDLTGGVTSEIYTTDILDKEHFWREQLLRANEDFLFGCSTGVWGKGWGERKGIVELHAYSVLRAVEMDGKRLLLLKNPWGKHEWKGPWSNGSKEWTVEWLAKLNHKFGEDGTFWISLDDFLRKFQAIDRTRLFGPDWKVASIATTLHVPWTVEYHDTRFGFTLSRPGPVVVVLWQLDDRYFRGLEGQYRFQLAFRIHRAGEDDYVVRSQTYYRMNRSVNVELDPLEAGDYDVLVRIDAHRDEELMRAEEVVRANAKGRREKLLRVGLAHDLAHGKGRIVETAEERSAREAYEKRKRERAREEFRRKMLQKRDDEHYLEAKHLAKLRKRAQKKKTRRKERMERKEAEKARKAAEERERREKRPGTDGQGKQGGEDAREPAAAELTPGEGTPKEAKVEAGSKGADVKPGEVPGEVKENGAPEPAKEETPKSAAQMPGTPRPVTVGCSSTGSEAAGTPAKEQEPGIAEDGEADAKDGESSGDQGENTPASSVVLKSPAGAGAGEGQAEAGPDDAAEFQEAAAKQADTKEAATQTEAPPDSSSGTESDEEGPPGVELVVHPVTARMGPWAHMGPPPPPPNCRPPPPGRHPGMPPPGYYRPQQQVVMGHYPRPPGPGGFVRGPPDSDDGSDDDGLGSVSSVSDISDRELEIHMADAKRLAAAQASTAQRAGPSPSSAAPGRAAYPDEEDEFEKDPWNAVGVFGLRVYYRVSEAERERGAEAVKLRVVRPDPYSDPAQDKGAPGEDEKVGPHECMVLDVDDAAKDATLGEEEAAEKLDAGARGGGEMKEGEAEAAGDETSSVSKGGDSGAS